MRFLITSHGASASSWTAAGLNAHPQFFCVHGTHLGEGGPDDVLNPEQIRREHGAAGLLEKMQSIRSGARTREEITLDAQFAHIEARSTMPNCGMVHTYRLRDLPRLPPYEGPAVSVYNLVRHPVDLVNSAQHLFTHLLQIDLNELQWTARHLFEQKLDLIEGICAKHDILPGDLKVLSFFAALRALDGLEADLKAMDWVKDRPEYNWRGTVAFETVTADPLELATIGEALGGAPGPAYPAEIAALPVLNRHVGTEVPLTTEQKWDAWQDWQREAFQIWFEQLDLSAKYSEFGYQFDVLKT